MPCVCALAHRHGRSGASFCELHVKVHTSDTEYKGDAGFEVATTQVDISLQESLLARAERGAGQAAGVEACRATARSADAASRSGQGFLARLAVRLQGGELLCCACRTGPNSGPKAVLPCKTVAPPELQPVDFEGEFWSAWRDSNSRPLAPHASALPGCATRRQVADYSLRLRGTFSRQRRVRR
jgi:hypothetical protein